MNLKVSTYYLSGYIYIILNNNGMLIISFYNKINT